jgi:hypothetical protein
MSESRWKLMIFSAVMEVHALRAGAAAAMALDLISKALPVYRYSSLRPTVQVISKIG